MSNTIKQKITRSIQLADQIIKETDFACSFKQECADIKFKTGWLHRLLRQTAHISNNLYERPTRRIIDNTEQILDKTLKIVFKCQANRFRQLFTTISAAAVYRSSLQIYNSIEDVDWLLRISTPPYDYAYNGAPTIAVEEPVLCVIWEQIAHLHCGTLDDRADAAASLLVIVRGFGTYKRLIIEEGGVEALLRFVEEGGTEGKESAIRALGLLCCEPESIEQVIDVRRKKYVVCSVGPSKSE